MVHLSDSPEILDLKPELSDFRKEVVESLSSMPKRISPKFFYDEEGSRIFDEITLLDEYYPTRSEMEILSTRCSEISSTIGSEAVIIELGSGNGEKGARLLKCLPDPSAYVLVDISRESLETAWKNIRSEFPEVNVKAVWADYTRNEVMESLDFPGRKSIVFLGSTIGNMEPSDARRFIASCRRVLSPGENFIIGVDLKKGRAKLENAYNDSLGVTARFNLNLISRINREFGPVMDPAYFRHISFYNQEAGRIEMHLECLRDHDITLDGREIHFSRGETIHTENSYKYSGAEFMSILRESGFSQASFWTDSGSNFGLFSARA